MKLLFLVASFLCIAAVWAAAYVAASAKKDDNLEKDFISLLEKEYAGIAPFMPDKKTFYADHNDQVIDISARAVDDAGKESFVNEHNKVRSGVDPTATNMKKMVCTVYVPY